MSESLEIGESQRAESTRERYEREAMRAIAAEYGAIVERADELLRAEPVFRRNEILPYPNRA
jgi:hypothetical protein